MVRPVPSRPPQPPPEVIDCTGEQPSTTTEAGPGRQPPTTTEVAPKTKATGVETVKSTGTNLGDIRGEIEEIQLIIAKIQKERTQQPKPEEGGPTESTETAPKKDPKRNAEIRELISRLKRLSIRHDELKARQIANSVTRDPAPVSATAVTSQ
jgi:hypothetical protein